MKADGDKALVRDFWDRASCGEELYLQGSDALAYERQAASRYELEPYIADFAQFDSARNRSVLEIGVGLGADHQRFAEAGARLHGIDLTERAIVHTQKRLAAFGLSSTLSVGDAESLTFPNESFDLVYSWGVLHHSPNTPKAVNEVYRVLRKGGEARIMIYYKWSIVGVMLWLRYALLSLRPWTPISDVYAKHLESPGTKAYSFKEAEQMFAAFGKVRIRSVLTHGDLLTSSAGQRHKGTLLTIARMVWPRAIIRLLFPNNGLFLLVSAVK